MTRSWIATAVELGLALGALACGRSEPPRVVRVPEPAAPASAEAPAGLPPTAQPVMLEEIRRDLDAVCSASDGGGRAWLERGADRVVAGETARFPIVYEAGPHGIAPGGSILLERKLYWYWSAPQISKPDAPGYVTARSEVPGVELALREVAGHGVAIDVGGVAVEVRGRALRAGERVRIVYGAGPAAAAADSFAERGEHLWLRVDGDGDGVSGLVPDSPGLDVVAGPAARLLLLLPSTARPGDSVRLVASFVDRFGNLAGSSQGEIRLQPSAELEAPATLALGPADGGHKEVSVAVRAPGILAVRGQGPRGMAAESNPLVALPETPRVVWGDLHGHSNFSDGSGTPDDYFRYARDVAALDVAALTDHDHVGARFLDANPERWEEIRRSVQAFDEPGRFVALLGFEWTNWIYGHRHVLYFSEAGELLSSVDPRYDTPGKLWAALRGLPALSIAHHSAGGTMAIDWSAAPDPELEPVTEIASVQGSSESVDTPYPIRAPVRANFVRNALDRGYRLGLVASGDSHDGHPGLVQLFRGESGGLAAILSEDLSREGVRAALRARRVYATNGPRIYLAATLDGVAMGSALPLAKAPPAETPKLVVLVVGTSELDRVDVVRSGTVTQAAPGEGRRRISLALPLEGLRAGDWVYVRAVQRDGGAAWSSPFFIE